MAPPISLKSLILCADLLHAAVTQSSSGGVAICYVISVMWLTSRLAVVGQVGRPTTTSGVATPARSLTYMNALLPLPIDAYTQSILILDGE